MQKIGNISTHFRSMVAGVLLLIFASFIANISLFLHYHVVDGVTIVHSHIHSDDHTQDPYDSSTHTKSELTLIHAIDNFLVESPSTPFILGVAFSIVLFIYVISNNHTQSVAHSTHPPLRGPPADYLIG